MGVAFEVFFVRCPSNADGPSRRNGGEKAQIDASLPDGRIPFWT